MFVEVKRSRVHGAWVETHQRENVIDFLEGRVQKRGETCVRRAVTVASEDRCLE